MMKDSYLMPELDRIQASRGLILCWPILTGRNIEIFLVWSANIFPPPPCLGCLTGWQLTAGCCSVKSRPGAGILILHLQSPSTPSSPLLSAAVALSFEDSWPKIDEVGRNMQNAWRKETFLLHYPHCTVDRFEFSQPRSKIHKIHKIHKNEVKPLLMTFTWQPNIFQ